MRFKIRDIADGGLDVQVPITAAWLAAECPDIDIKPGPKGVRLRGRLERTGDSYLARLKIEGSLAAACARCLEPAAIKMNVPLVATYVERNDKSSGENGDEEPDGDEAVLVFAGGIIDLGPAVRDEILLAMPMTPLCREDCAGICPVCGGNRNTSPCDCAEKQRQAQAKLAALADLKLSLKANLKD